MFSPKNKSSQCHHHTKSINYNFLISSNIWCSIFLMVSQKKYFLSCFVWIGIQSSPAHCICFHISQVSSDLQVLPPPLFFLLTICFKGKWVIGAVELLIFWIWLIASPWRCLILTLFISVNWELNLEASSGSGSIFQRGYFTGGAVYFLLHRILISLFTMSGLICKVGVSSAGTIHYKVPHELFT